MGDGIIIYDVGCGGCRLWRYMRAVLVLTFFKNCAIIEGCNHKIGVGVVHYPPQERRTHG